MRAAIAAVGLMVLAGPSIAAPASPGAIGQSADTLQATETVHCRPFRHWHSWGYGHGCGPRAYFDEGVRFHRFGFRGDFRDRDHFRDRGRFGFREDFRGDRRSGTSFRSEGRDSFRANGSVRSNGGATTSGQSGAGMRSGASGGGMTTSPTGGGRSGGSATGGAGVSGGASATGGAGAAGGASGGTSGAGSGMRQ